MSEQKTVATYGYHATEAPQIFQLAEGEKLPKGWHDHPDKAQEGPKASDLTDDEKAKRAEAIRAAVVKLGPHAKVGEIEKEVGFDTSRAEIVEATKAD
jgi:hypothetical protein